MQSEQTGAWRKRFGLALASTAFSVLLLEGALRAYHAAEAGGL
jgi:hypothetical protein